MPRDFYFLAERHRVNRREEFLRTGMLISTVVNMFLSKGKTPTSPWDFVPGGAPLEVREDTAQQAFENAKLFAFKHNARLKAKGLTNG